ncbi:DinB family protein [Paenactinomyces guangxiensis]|uniref:DinB family protein n=1 Tax=Paenactinomyces guangxiensis TaxID=1490290 RepID=A0A7W1WQI5_9BACL|nr:DinB family protein [Paenactinomyces guangxiensis]MBA4494213.1 DinB family protein [Paenactinomyces guangxiensis]MBH8590709.1 DinB family protein [Paenactinomyces guangxiensis]
MLEMTKVREELWDAVSGLSDEELNQRVSAEKWTIAQVLEHLYLVERAVASQIKHGLYDESDQPYEVKPIDRVLNRSVKIKVPNPALEPKTNFQSLESLKVKLDKSRHQLLEAMENLDPELSEKRALPHPGFGRLSIKQWTEFIPLHEKRHIHQIKETRKELKLP